MQFRVIETVFGFPGIGKLLVDSVLSSDIPTVQAIALIMGLGYVSLRQWERSAELLFREQARDVAAMAADKIEMLLRQSQLLLGEVSEAYSLKYEKGTVMTQDHRVP